MTYVLTTGGHNAGIVSEPGHAGRSYRVATRNNHYLDPERYLAEAQTMNGSWWPEWVAWLTPRSGPATIIQAMGAPQSGYAAIDDAPGSYVFQR